MHELYDSMEYTDIYDLKMGDRFIEEFYSEVWEVIGFEFQDNHKWVLAEVVGSLSSTDRMGETSQWGYLMEVYSPKIMRYHG